MSSEPFSSDLLKSRCLVHGQWACSITGKTFSVNNPADGSLIGTVPDMVEDDFTDALDSSKEAFYYWKSSLASDRSAALKAWHAAIIANQDALARILTLEQGKPLRESRAEIRYAASFVEWYAEEAKRLNGEIIPPHQSSKRVLVLRQPVGVVAAITPWNFPAAMITRKVAPALAAGCTVVCKPAPQTPLTALALAELANRSGIPPGVFNVVTTTDAETFGRLVTENSLVSKISFTGSTAIGKKLMAACAQNVTRISLELGGNAPFIVFDDADVDSAIEGALLSKFRNAGQTCVCTNRFLVHRRISQEFANRLSLAASNLRVGNGLDVNTDIGPLIDENALNKVETLLSEARSKGASVVCGGSRHSMGGNFFQPTVLAGVKSDMRIVQEEIFGPVAPILEFASEQEAIYMANSTRSGLAAYFYTRDFDRFWRVSESLEYGIVGHNTGLISTEVAPFGGVKESGLGREGSHHGILDYTELKYICAEVKRDE
jgi:succinate-semialdehyde dehydrogenase / glutarate-semialdehyde dehydrogenase